jgi:hypothetical protein
MQLPTRPADPNSLIAMLKNLRTRPAKILFRELTAEHLNIHDLIRNLDKRSDEQSTRQTCFTFFPGNSNPLHPTLPRAKEFFIYDQLRSEVFFLWCFAPCSRTVQGFVHSTVKMPQLEARIGQLLGFIPEFDEDMSGRPRQIVAVYAWLHILFENLWALLASTMDPAPRVTPSSKVQWRSKFAERAISAFEALTIAVYIAERIIYTDPGTNAGQNFQDDLDTIDNLCSNIETAVMVAVPRQLAVGRCEGLMEIKIRQKFRDMVLKSQEKNQFTPYRFFLGKQPAGTGETHLKKYAFLLLLICGPMAFSQPYYQYCP